MTTDLLADKIGSPHWRKSFRPERKELICFFCSLWIASDTPSSFARRTGMPLGRVNETLGDLRGYVGIRSGGPRLNNYLVTFAFLQLHAPEEVKGLPVPALDLPPVPNLRGPKKSISESFGAYLSDLRSKERLDHQAQNQCGDQR